MKRRAGFTLVELLVVISLVAVIGMCLFSMFASALDMMRRVSGAAAEEDIGILMEKLDQEISSQVIFKGIPFDGKETSLGFPSRISGDPKSPANNGIGRVTYFFDDSHNAFARRQENLSQVYKKTEVSAVPILENVRNVKFQYYVYLKPQKSFQWVEEWNSVEKEGAVPYAVKIQFEWARGEEQHVFQKTLAIPVAESAR